MFQIFLPPEGGPLARNPFKIQEIGPLEKGGPFFKFVCPRREDPRLAIHSNPDSKKVNPEFKKVNPDSKKANPDSTGP